MTNFVQQCKIFDVQNCATPETPPSCPLKTVRFRQYGCLLFDCTQDDSPPASASSDSESSPDSGSEDLGTDSLVAIWLTGGLLLLLMAMILGFACWAVCSQKRWRRWPIISVLLNLMYFVLGTQQIFRILGQVFACLPQGVRNRIKRFLLLLFNNILRWVVAYIWNCTPPRRAVQFARPEKDPEMGLSAPIPPESNLTANFSTFNRTLSSSLPNFSQIFRFSTPRRNRTPVKQENKVNPSSIYPDLTPFFHHNNTGFYASSSNFTNSVLSPSLRPSAPRNINWDSPASPFFNGVTSTPDSLPFPITPSWLNDFVSDPDNYPEPPEPMDSDSLPWNNAFRQDSNTYPQSPPEPQLSAHTPLSIHDLAPELARYFRPPYVISNPPVNRHLNFDEIVESPQSAVRPSSLCPSCTACLTNTNLDALSCICSSFHFTPLSVSPHFQPFTRPFRSRPSPCSRPSARSRPSPRFQPSPPPPPSSSSSQLDISDNQQISIQSDQQQISNQSLANFSFGSFGDNAVLRFLAGSVQSLTESTSVMEFSAVSRFSLVYRRTQSAPIDLGDLSYPRFPIRKNCKRNREIGIDINNILLPRLRKKPRKECTFCD